MNQICPDFDEQIDTVLWFCCFQRWKPYLSISTKKSVPSR